MTDEGGGDIDEGKEVLRLAFVAAVQAAASCQPGHRPLHDPASRPSRCEDSIPLRAMRGVTPRARSRRRR